MGYLTPMFVSQKPETKCLEITDYFSGLHLFDKAERMVKLSLVVGYPFPPFKALS